MINVYLSPDSVSFKETIETTCRSLLKNLSQPFQFIYLKEEEFKDFSKKKIFCAIEGRQQGWSLLVGVKKIDEVPKKSYIVMRYFQAPKIFSKPVSKNGDPSDTLRVSLISNLLKVTVLATPSAVH